MSENKMKKFAELLGLELDEEFKLSDTNDKYKLTIDGVMQYPTWLERWIPANLPWAVLTGKLEIIKLPRQILNEKEKEYLSNVIKPFRDRVNYIIKTENSLGEYITIHSRLYTGCHHDVTLLPEFEKGAMYKGMEINKRYNLEELGL